MRYSWQLLPLWQAAAASRAHAAYGVRFLPVYALKLSILPAQHPCKRSMHSPEGLSAAG